MVVIKPALVDDEAAIALAVRRSTEPVEGGAGTPQPSVEKVPGSQRGARPKRAPIAPRVQPTRYYVIWDGPEELVGIHHAQWKVLQDQLPTGRLCGSGVSLKAFDVLREAEEFWVEKGWLPPAPLFP